jgi:hypothetical protein
MVLHLCADVGGNDPAPGEDEIFAAAETTIVIAWTVPAASPAKAIVHVPGAQHADEAGRREPC